MLWLWLWASSCPKMSSGNKFCPEPIGNAGSAPGSPVHATASSKRVSSRLEMTGFLGHVAAFSSRLTAAHRGRVESPPQRLKKTPGAAP
jgi:hypothetical protein